MVLTEILKYTIPSLIVFLTAFFVLKQMLAEQIKRYQIEANAKLALGNTKLITPIRLQAFERLVLFLERISPSNLIIRNNQPQQNCSQFQIKLITAIRDEFEHNLSQQLYVNNSTWEKLVLAKEEVVSLINTSASQIKSDEPASKLGELIINNERLQGKQTIKIAINEIKKELGASLL